MNILIIYAHPNPNSFNHAILEELTRGLSMGAHSYTVIDLYKENFDPVFDMDPANEVKLKDYRELIKQAEHLIFVYPAWWYGTPAILKGFIDKVFVPGFAYSNEGKLPKGLLAGKSAWVVYTINSPSWFVKLVRGSIEWKAMKDAFLNYCGFRRVKRMMFAGIKSNTMKERKKWLDYIYHQACYL